MFKKIIIATLAIWFPLQSTAMASAQAKANDFLVAETVAKQLGAIQTVGTALDLMQTNADPENADYLKKLGTSWRSAPLPKITTAGKFVSVKGLDSPLEIRDLSKGLFRYKNKDLLISYQDTVEKTFESLQKSLAGESASNWQIIPSAQALGWIPIILAIYLLGGVGASYACRGFDRGTSGNFGRPMSAECVGTGIAWPLLVAGVAGIAVVSAVSSAAKADELPAKMECTPKGKGWFITLHQKNGSKITLTTEGEKYTISPAATHGKKAELDRSVNDLKSACADPKKLEETNKAFSNLKLDAKGNIAPASSESDGGTGVSGK